MVISKNRLVINNITPLLNFEFLAFKDLPCRIAGAVDDSLLENHVTSLVTPSERKTMSRASLFTMVAANEALQQANWMPTDLAACEATGSYYFSKEG